MLAVADPALSLFRLQVAPRLPRASSEAAAWETDHKLLFLRLRAFLLLVSCFEACPIGAPSQDRALALPCLSGGGGVEN